MREKLGSKTEGGPLFRSEIKSQCSKVNLSLAKPTYYNMEKSKMKTKKN